MSTSSTTNNASLSQYDSTTRLLGLNNQYFNTNDLVDAELQALQAQEAPQQQQLTNLQSELSSWQSFQTDMSALTTAFDNVRFFQTGQKNVTYSQDGVVSFTASSTATNGKYSIQVSQLAQAEQLAGKDMGSSDTALGISDTVSINKQNLQISNTMTLRDVANAINSNTSYGVSASIIANRLVLTGNNTGASNAITLTDGTNGGLQSLGILNTDGTFANELQKAQDSQFTLNGISVSRSSNSVSDVIDGVTINLESTSSSPVTANVENDSASAVNVVSAMIDAYNKGISQYHSFTDKGDALQGQTIPLDMIRDMSDMTNFVSTTGEYLYQYGIQVNGTAKDGTLTLDKTKLTDMYNANPAKFEATFFGANGLGTYMDNKMYNYTGPTGVIQSKIDGVNKNITNLNDSISKFTTYYNNQKQSILDKYSAFETMLAGLNSQMQYVTAQFSSSSSSNG